MARVRTTGLALGMALITSAAQADVRYTVTFMPDTGFGEQDNLFPGAKGINNAGQVVYTHFHFVPGDTAEGVPPVQRRQAVLYTPGVEQPLDLGAGLEREIVWPHAINERGDVFGLAWNLRYQLDSSGLSFNVSRVDSLVWRYTAGVGTEVLPVPPHVADEMGLRSAHGQFNDHGVPLLNWGFHGGVYLPSGYQETSSVDPSLSPTFTLPWGVNNAGQIAGYTNPSGDVLNGFVYTPGAGLEMITAPGNYCEVLAIDETGGVCGRFAPEAGARHAFYKPAGQPIIDLHDSAFGGKSRATHIAGPYVAGYFSTTDEGLDLRAFRWDPVGGLIAIPLPDGWFRAQVYGVNRSGAVLGILWDRATFFGARSTPFVWTPETGTIVLKDVTEGTSNWVFSLPVGINDNGQVLLSMVELGTFRPASAVLTPVPSCTADFDQQNGVQVADIFAFLRAWFANSPSADFDGMNGIQVADIFSFLRAWFAGC